MDKIRKIVAGLILVFAIVAHTAVPYPTVTAGGGIKQWETAKDYFIDDIVWEGEEFYKALTDHTSGVFATDLANLEWVQMADDINFVSASTDGGIVRWDGVTGEVVQDSSVIIDDFGNITDINTLAIGQSVSPSATSLIDFNSTIAGTRPWTFLTTAQRDAIVSPAVGLAIYNTDTNLVNVYNGTTWGAVGGGITAWAPVTNYNQGDVVYNGGDTRQPVYRANATFVSAAVFNPASWTELAQHIDANATSVTNALIRWNGVTGDAVSDTGLIVDGSDNMSGLNDLAITGDVTYGTTQFNFTSNFSDGTDLGSMVLSGGGALGSGRGATMFIYGNEQGGVGQQGGFRMFLGDAAGAQFSVRDRTDAEIFNVLETGSAQLPLLTPSQNLSLDASGNIISGPTNVSSGSVTGVLPVVNGGTGSSILTADRLVYYDGVSITSTSSLSYDTNIFEVSTPDGSIPMTKMNQASRLALTPVNGTTVYDTDDEIPYFWDGTEWLKFGGGTAISSATLALDDYDELTFPLSQATVVSSTPSKILRLETGSEDFLTNGSFEHETYTTGWTTSGSATFTLNPDGFEGRGVSISATGGTQSFDLFQSYTDTDFQGVTWGFTCMIKSDSAKVQLCTSNGTIDKDCVFHDGQGKWKKMQAIINVDSSGILQGSIKNIANEDAELVVDSCKWSNDPLKIKSNIKSQSITFYGTDASQNNPPEYKFLTSNLVLDGAPNIAVTQQALYTEFVVLRDIDVNIYFNAGQTIAGNVTYIRVNGNIVGHGSHNSTNTYGSNASFNGKLKAGDLISLGGTGTRQNGDPQSVSILSTYSTEEILSAADIVSSDSIPFVFKGSGAGALDCDSDPIGTYTTFSKAASTNVFSQCATGPLIPPTNIDGINMRGYGYTSAAACGASGLSKINICVGKGLKGIELQGYQLAARAGLTLTTDTGHVYNGSAAGYGIEQFYNSKTGIYSLNSGISVTSTETGRQFTMEDGAGLNAGYFHFSGSKNPVVNAIETIPNINYSWENDYSARINSNGVCVVLTENVPFIDSCVRNSVGDYTIGYAGLGLTSVPAITVEHGSSVGRFINIASISTTEVNIVTHRDMYDNAVAAVHADAFTIDFKLSRQGSDYRDRGNIAAVIAQPTCFIKDIKPNGTQGGNSATNTFITRDLNTLEGVCDGISLNANQVTINTAEPSTWIIEAKSSCRGTDGTALHWIKEPTGGGTGEEIKSGMSDYCENNVYHNSGVPELDASFSKQAGSNTYELQMHTSTFNAVGTESLGRANVADGLPETYTTVKLTRIK